MLAQKKEESRESEEWEWDQIRVGVRKQADELITDHYAGNDTEHSCSQKN